MSVGVITKIAPKVVYNVNFEINLRRDCYALKEDILRVWYFPLEHAGTIMMT